MRHEIPTHLNVEDRAFYGLSARQVTYLTLGCASAYAAWTSALELPLAARLAPVAVCVLIALTLALVRPLGRSLEAWAFLGLRYLALPKRAVWRCAILDPVIDAQGEEGWAEWSPALAWSEEAV